jgi:hypothetical protein
MVLASVLETNTALKCLDFYCDETGEATIGLNAMDARAGCVKKRLNSIP